MKKFCISLICVLIAGCAGNSKLSNRNLSYIYTPGFNFIRPEYRACNIGTDTTRFFFRVNESDLLFVKSGDTDQFSSEFAVAYRVIPDIESKAVLDSGVRYFQFPQPSDSLTESYFYGQFDLHAPDSMDCLVQLTFTDQNRNQAVECFYPVDKTGLQPAQDFMVIDDSTGKPFIPEYTGKPVLLRIMNARDHAGPLYIRYFKNEFPLAMPPFSEAEPRKFSYVATVTTRVEWPLENAVELTEPGIYHFQFDTLVKEGLTIMVYEPDFPKLTSYASLIESIRYITNRQEYDKLVASANKRDAIDNFWLELSGNRERARVLIRSYYSRVQVANRLFSSYCEGWKTDRGLIYIIFGPPSTMYMTKKTENWNYSQNYNYGNLSFTFDKIQNPFSSKDYRLRRNAYYEIPWYRAVDSWRDGRVVNESD